VIDTSAHLIDEAAKTVRANNGQLAWDYGKGYVTFDTPGSLGYVGYAGGQTLAFDHAKLRPETPMATVYFTANGLDANLTDARSILVTTVARGINGSDVIDELTPSPLQTAAWNAPPEERGGLIVEPVVVAVEWTGAPIRRIVALDHGGSLTDPVKTVPFTKEGDAVRFTLDGRETQAFYYLIECE